MLKLMLHVRRKEGLTREEFRQYYESTHAPLASGVMATCKKYVRNFVIEEPHGTQGFDCVTEFWFDIDGPFSEATGRLTDAAQAALLAEDEARFMDRDSMRIVIVEEAESDPALLKGNRE